MPQAFWRKSPPKNAHPQGRFFASEPLRHSSVRDPCLTPWKINGWTMSSWRCGSDHFPLKKWVMAVGSSRSSSRVFHQLRSAQILLTDTSKYMKGWDWNPFTGFYPWKGTYKNHFLDVNFFQYFPQFHLHILLGRFVRRFLESPPIPSLVWWNVPFLRGIMLIKHMLIFLMTPYSVCFMKFSDIFHSDNNDPMISSCV